VEAAGLPLPDVALFTVLQAELVEAKDSLHDLKFAPKHLGLRLATCGSDRHVRVYEAPDVMDQSSWLLLHEFETDASSPSAGGRPGAPQCLAWNSSAMDSMMLAVGLADGAVYLWAFHEQHNSWSCLLGFEALEAGRSHSAHLDCVHDVAWAPDVGRSYHLLATASRDKRVKLWKLLQSEPRSAPAASASGGSNEMWRTSCSCEFLHASQVWRVSWNVCGSMLAASLDEGKVHVYKLDGKGEWRRAWSSAAPAPQSGPP